MMDGGGLEWSHPRIREKEVAIDFLNPRGPARSFTYPERPDNLVVGMGDILTTAHPTTATGRT